MNDRERPHIILSAAMTIDGKIASKTGDPQLSDEEDWKDVHKLRTEVDAIMVGKGTILKDDPKLHIKYYKHDGYYRIIADSNLSIPLDSKAITFESELYPTIICTNESVSEDKIREYEKYNVKIIKAGKKERVNLKKILSRLSDFGIKRILLEGGGNLNWSFIKADLIDEMRITIAPWIIGGSEAITLVEGKGFERMEQAQRFDLISVKMRNNYIILYYKRMRE